MPCGDEKGRDATPLLLSSAHVLQESSAMSRKPPYSVPRILRMRSEGRTNTEIASACGISKVRVGQIIKSERERTEAAERAQQRRRRIRAGHDLNDLDAKLPVGDLLCVLELPSVVSARLGPHNGGLLS
jgi:hypothetical protein